MSDTTRLALPRLDAAQSQKHVTHNEALAILDALTHLSVAARNVVAPPAAPVEGARYLIGAAPTGAFAGGAGSIAAYDDGAWRLLAPRPGWRAYVESEKRIVIFDGAAWTPLAIDVAELQNMRLLGIGGAADAANPLLAKLNSAALTALRAASGGSGDVRLKLDREQATNAASLLYQTNWSGRAEAGLLGDDAYRIKVSPDGAAWKDALVVNPATGRVTFPNGATDAVGADPANYPIAKANTVTFTAWPTAEGGVGDLRLKLNREQTTKTVSQLYQSNWSGRAETGLIGDDAYRIKVSPDGAAWKDALIVNPATGRVTFPNGATDSVGVDPANYPIAKANTVTFTAWPTAEGGVGDLRFKLNREQAGRTVSQLYQSNWSGRAETGLMGDDAFRIKVSPDGAAWREALNIDPATGRVFFPNGATDLIAAATLTTGTPATYLLSAPLRGPLPDGALIWMVPHVPNATALNVDPTLQLDQIDAAPLPLRNFDGGLLPQGALEAGRAVLVRRIGATYCVQSVRAPISPVNLLEDGGRFAGNPEPVAGAVTTYADVTYFTNANGALRANYGVARIGAAMPAAIPDLLNKIRAPAAQVAGTEFFVMQVTAGAGTTLGANVQGVNFYQPLTASRGLGRGVTASLYFRVMSGALVMAPLDNVARMLVDGVAHNVAVNTAERVFTPAQGWKHMQMWVTAQNGATTSFWPMRVTPGTVFLLALPAVTPGFETIPWDIGPTPSLRGWR